MTKCKAKAVINKMNNYYFNQEFKDISISIIENVPDEDNVKSYFDFIMNRIGIGFKYDLSPEMATGDISYIFPEPKKNINVSDDVKENENKLIIGENYEALKNLLLTHKNKIDIIYVDPPYNTESAKSDGNQSSKNGKNNKFLYKDKFGRNAWLNVMRDRFYLAEKLLNDNGYLFISIDDSEQAYLKIILDDIFGNESYLGCFPRITSFPNHLKKDGFAQLNDYVLVYSKSLKPLNIDITEFSLNHQYLFINSSFRNTEADSEFKKLDLFFSYPKPTSLIEKIIQLVPNNENKTILDFFAGSGSTGHAVMKMNQKDGGKRKFILCTNNENGIADNILLPRMNRIISGKISQDSENFGKWVTKDYPPFSNENLRVFSIKKVKFPNEFNKTLTIKKLETKIEKNLKFLNPSFEKKSNWNLKYDLSSLSNCCEKHKEN